MTSKNHEQKTCPRCQKTKNRNSFCRMHASNDGLQGWCRSCSNEYGELYREKYYPENRKEILSYKSQHYQDNKERILKQQREYRQRKIAAISTPVSMPVTEPYRG